MCAFNCAFVKINKMRFSAKVRGQMWGSNGDVLKHCLYGLSRLKISSYSERFDMKTRSYFYPYSDFESSLSCTIPTKRSKPYCSNIAPLLEAKSGYIFSTVFLKLVHALS
jgi:hypothetical protein